MIQITKEESLALRKRLGDVNIAITSKSKKGGRKKYYVEEVSRVMNALNQIRREGGTR